MRLLSLLILIANYSICFSQTLLQNTPDFDGEITHLVSWGDSVLFTGNFQHTTSNLSNIIHGNNKLLSTQLTNIRYPVIATSQGLVFAAQHLNEVNTTNPTQYLYQYSMQSQLLVPIGFNQGFSANAPIALSNDYAYIAEPNFNLQRIDLTSGVVDTQWAGDSISSSNFKSIHVNNNHMWLASYSGSQVNAEMRDLSGFIHFNTSISLSTGTSVIKGEIVGVDSNSFAMVLWDGDSTRFCVFNQQQLLNQLSVKGEYVDVALVNNTMIVVGNFNSYSEVIEFDISSATLQDVGITSNANIKQVQALDTTYILQGDFTRINGVYANSYAEFNVTHSLNSKVDSAEYAEVSSVYWRNQSATIDLGINLKKPVEQTTEVMGFDLLNETLFQTSVNLLGAEMIKVIHDSLFAVRTVGSSKNIVVIDLASFSEQTVLTFPSTVKILDISSKYALILDGINVIAHDFNTVTQNTIDHFNQDVILDAMCKEDTIFILGAKEHSSGYGQQAELIKASTQSASQSVKVVTTILGDEYNATFKKGLIDVYKTTNNVGFILQEAGNMNYQKTSTYRYDSALGSWTNFSGYYKHNIDGSYIPFTDFSLSHNGDVVCNSFYTNNVSNSIWRQDGNDFPFELGSPTAFAETIHGSFRISERVNSYMVIAGKPFGEDMYSKHKSSGRAFAVFKDTLLNVTSVTEQTTFYDEPIIYPNPASNWVYVPANKSVDFIQIFDVNGKQVAELNPLNNRFSLNNLNAGVYIVLVQLELEQPRRIKLVVSK